MAEVNYSYEVVKQSNGVYIALMKANSDTIHSSIGFATEESANGYAEGYYKGFAHGMVYGAINGWESSGLVGDKNEEKA
jgi:uncharacterized protein YegP (UPF0339 family)